MMLFVQLWISKSFHTFSFLWTEALPKGKLQRFVTCCDLAVLYWLLSYCSRLKWVSLGKLCLQMELRYFRPSLCWTSQWIWTKWNKRNSTGPKDFSLTATLQVSWKQLLHFLSCPCISFFGQIGPIKSEHFNSFSSCYGVLPWLIYHQLC